MTEDEKAEAIELAREEGEGEREREPVPERDSPVIDDDVTGPVNAAVPPGDDDR